MGELKQKASRYSDSFEGAPSLADEALRARKAAKIQAVLAEEGMFDRAGIRILDIGCSFGIILTALTPADGLGVGIDIDRNLGSRSDNVEFIRGDAEHLPFSPAAFDVVICNHVYEHTDDAKQLLREINRVLKTDGVCYFAGPNKFELIEPHYRLPFLSWLPRSLADRYMRISGKGSCYPEKPYSLPNIRTLVSNFQVISYTEKILRDPVRYNSTDILPVVSVKRLIAIVIYRFVPFFFPGFVYILKKTAP